MARASARRFTADQDEIRAIGSAVAALLPADGFRAGEDHRLRVGSYRTVIAVAVGWPQEVHCFPHRVRLEPDTSPGASYFDCVSRWRDVDPGRGVRSRSEGPPDEATGVRELWDDAVPDLVWRSCDGPRPR